MKAGDLEQQQLVGAQHLQCMSSAGSVARLPKAAGISLCQPLTSAAEDPARFK